MDQDPREGAAVINAQRVHMFHDLAEPQLLYEPVSDTAALLRYLLLDYRLRQLGLIVQRPIVQITFDVFDQIFSAPLGRVEIPPAREQRRGVHAVVLVGLEAEGERFVFRNSWGGEWGNRGYGAVPRRYLDRYMRDAFVTRNVRFGWSLRRTSGDEPTTDDEWRAVWQTVCRRMRTSVAHRRERLRLVYYDALSFAHEPPVVAEIVELQSIAGMRLGWAHVFHTGNDDSVIKELFVWPSFRRRGYGAILEHAARARATRRGSTRLSLYLHSVDTLPGHKNAGSAFGAALGYHWHWAETALPNLAAIGHLTV